MLQRIVSELTFFSLVAAGLSACGDDGAGAPDAGNQNQPGAICGNAEIEGSEACDDGPLNSDTAPDACRTDCRSAGCGDGVIDAGEACDDGPQNSDETPDGCRSGCRLPACGDGVVDRLSGEICDCGLDPTDLPGRCARENSDAPDPLVTCRPDCTPAGCGDGLRLGEELCDGTDLGGHGCADFGYYAGTLACTSACSFDLSGCALTCGDGAINGPDETCDGSQLGSGSCVGLGFDLGALGCTAHCTPALDDCRSAGWPVFHTQGNLPLHGLVAPGPDTLVAVGEAGVVIQFDGVTWTTLPPPTTERLRAVWADAVDDVFVVGNAGFVARWDGTAWTTLPTGVVDPLHAVWGTSAQDVWAVGNGGAVLHWDGLAFSLERPTDESLRAVHGPGDGSVLFAGQGGTILRFEGGVFTPEDSGTTAFFRGLGSSGPTDVYAVGNDGMGGVALHFDGTAWVSVLPAGLGLLNAVWVGSPDQVVAVGSSGVTVHFDGQGWREARPVALADLTAVAGRADDRLWATDTLGNVRSFRGTDWADVGPTAAGVVALGGAGLDAVLAVDRGSPNRGYRFDGSAWVELPFASPMSLPLAIWVGGPDLAVVVGAVGQIFHLDPDVGFVAAASPTTRALQAVSGTGPDDVWAVGEQSTVLHWTGATWSVVPGPATSFLTAVWAAAPGDVWTGGSAGLLHRHDGVGYTDVVLLPAPATLRAIAGRAPDDAYAAGQSASGQGAAFHFDGTAWIALPEAPVPILALAPLPGGDLFAVGQDDGLWQLVGDRWVPVRLPPSVLLAPGLWGTDRQLFLSSQTGGLHTLLRDW